MKVKKWNITLLSLNEDKKIKSDYFTTADSDAYLQVQLTDKMIDVDKVIFTMYNKKDESLVSKKGIWKNNIASFHLTDEIIVHNGEWVFQVVFIISEKKYVSRPLTFTIHNYLLDNHPPKLEIIENWDLLVKQANFLVDELEQYANDISQSKNEIDKYKNEIMILLNALKIANVEEEKRKQNEITRMENEIGRVDTENERITQENNRVIRENDRAGSETIRETNEADRIANENERKTNENTRELVEDTRITQETIRRNNEDARITQETIRRNNEDTRITQENIRRNNETQRQTTLAPRITSLETIINSADLVNYGIESGSNNRGNWVKFPDGTMIQWYGSATKDYNCTNAWGSLYYSGYESWTYPVPFIQAPRVIAEYNKFTGDAWVISGGERKTATNSGDYYLVRPASGSVKGNIDYIAIGRWK